MKRSALCFAMLMFGAANASAAVVVSPGDLHGWSFFTTNSSGTIAATTGSSGLVNGPSTPPLGTGSANLYTGPSGGGATSAQMRNSDWSGTALSALTTLSYSTYATAWNGAQDSFLQLYIDTNNDGAYDDRLYFEPTYSRAAAGNGNPNPQADPALNTWQTWNLLTGMWYSDSVSGPGSNAKPFSYFLSQYPSAKIVNDVNNQGGLGGIRITAGLASASNSFNVSIDAFSIGTSAGTTTYDFEAVAPVPEPGSLIVWSLLGLTIGGAAKWKRKRSA